MAFIVTQNDTIPLRIAWRKIPHWLKPAEAKITFTCGKCHCNTTYTVEANELPGPDYDGPSPKHICSSCGEPNCINVFYKRTKSC